MAKNTNPHYVNNAEFSDAVVNYVRTVRTAREKKEEIPIVPDYIAVCILRIAEGLSHKGNFIRYTYREEMVMDAVENCLRAIKNYNIDAPTRTGKPNAFAYFTQICWYAFLRRISLEKKEYDTKLKYISESGIENFVEGDDQSNPVFLSFMDQLKDRMDKVKDADQQYKTYKKAKTTRKRKVKSADSDLSEFL